MDRKMDSGVLEEGESLDEEYDVARPLLPEEILGIIDQLLCHEMAWHLGYPPAQTLLTSVYVEALTNPAPKHVDQVHLSRASSEQSGEVEEPPLLFILRAYCAGLLKTCDMVNAIMADELFYEEEDFVRNTCDRSLLHAISTSDVKSILQDAVAELGTLDGALRQEMHEALRSRLELRISFLDAIDLHTIRRAAPEASKMPWARMRDLIGVIEDQHALGKAVPEAFSVKLQRRLTSTMPPRPMAELSFTDCIAHFKRFFEAGAEAIDVLQSTDAQCLLNFILTFQMQKPQPLVFIRSMLQNLVFNEMVVLGRFSIRDLLDQDLSLGVLPWAPLIDRSFDDVEVPTDARYKIASSMETFRQHVAEPYIDMLRILCQNRCRVRRTLCHQVQEWDIMETVVGRLDEGMFGPLRDISQGLFEEADPQYLPLSCWVYFYKLRQMEWIVQLGFELSIYQPDELAGMYSYLKRLASARAQHVKRVQHAIALWEEKVRKDLKLPRNAPLPPEPGRQFECSGQHLRATLLEAACTWEFADGLSLLYLALTRLGLVTSPPRPYSTDELRYELRMRPFAPVTFPELPVFEEFRRQVELPDVNTTDVLRYAEAAIGAARKGFEASIRADESEAFSTNAAAHARWVGNVKNCLRATIAANLAISTLKRSYQRVVHESTGKGKEAGEDGDLHYKDLLRLKIEIPEPADGYHEWWIVPKLTQLT
ncbi:Mak10-domain-containing protein [Xylariaceae sp. FL0594]|nr:Mak10-domain-containing protein [Xylariaceae sp. FL0594]